MAAPAATTTTGQDEAVVKTTTMPQPRAIQLVMAMSSGSKSSTITSTKTIGDKTVHSTSILWFKLVFVPSILIFILVPARMLCGDDDHDEQISAAGDLGSLAVDVLLCVYMAAVNAAGGHLGFSAPRMPYAAWETLHKVGYEWMSLLLLVISVGVHMLDQVWPLLVAWVYLLGLLVASTIAFWLCLLRTYGDGGGERRRENSSCGEAVIDGLAYLYSRLLYEFAVRFPAVAVPDAGMQQLNAVEVAV